MVAKWLALGALLAGVPVSAQTIEPRVVIPGEGRGTLTFYERPGFGGQAVTYRSREPNVRLPFYPGSVRAEGTWRLCPDVQLRGRCLYANSSYRTIDQLGLRFNVRSLAPDGPIDGGYPNPGGSAGGETLRGFASQYFPQPRYGAQRVLACQNSSQSLTCARQSADRFCQQASRYPRAVFFERESRRNGLFLADVLCAAR